MYGIQHVLHSVKYLSFSMKPHSGRILETSGGFGLGSSTLQTSRGCIWESPEGEERKSYIFTSKTVVLHQDVAINNLFLLLVVSKVVNWLGNCVSSSNFERDFWRWCYRSTCFSAGGRRDRNSPQQIEHSYRIEVRTLNVRLMFRQKERRVLCVIVIDNVRSLSRPPTDTYS